MTAVRRRSIPWCVLALVAASGCAEVAPDEATTTTTTQDFISPYVGQQGRLLEGFKDPDVRGIAFSTLTGVRVDATGQVISNELQGKQLIGVPILGTAASDPNLTVSMRIVSVEPPATGSDKWEYVLEQLDSSSGLWGPACDQPVPLVPLSDPPPTPIRAIAIPGAFTAAGLYTSWVPGISFACRTGVIGKCDSWGYSPLTVPPHVTVLGMVSTAAGPDMLQACVRMARADYCGLGLPNTIEGTPIHIDDVFSGRAPVDGFPFEAVWSGPAMKSRDAGFTQSPVVCLSKLRWSTLPLGGDCPLQVADPRTNDKGKYCEDWDPLALEQRGVLLMSSSSFIDAGLYTYTDPTTSARLTTTKLVPEKAGQPPVWKIPAPTGVSFPVAGETTQFEATLLAPVLPVTVSTVSTTGLVPLVSYRCAGDLITSTAPPSGDASCQPIATEGFIYPPGTAGRAPLRRWLDPVLGRAWTTATSPTKMLANRWQLTEVVGGVVRAAIDVNVRWSAAHAGSGYAIDVELRTGEWITSCIDNAHIGSATSFAYRGTCVGVSGRTVNHADVVAFRVTYLQGSLPLAVSQLYDGFSSDIYIPLPGGATTATNVRWSPVGSTYEVDVLANGLWLTCAGPQQLATETAYLHTGICPAHNQSAPISQITQIRVCPFLRGVKQACTTVPYAGASDVRVPLKLAQ